jgi:nicotinamidase-related amidase
MSVTTLDTRTALVLIDLQKMVTAFAPEEFVDPVVRVCASLADAFRSAGQPVILVRGQCYPDWADAPRNRATNPILNFDTAPPGYADILDGLGQQTTDVIVTKRQPGAFYGTDLDLQLRRRGVTGIVLGGLLTGLGVEAAGLSAFDHGYNVTFAVDAMDDIRPGCHQHSIDTLFPILGEVGTAEEITRLLGSRAA